MLSEKEIAQQKQEYKEWFEGVETDLRKIMAGTDDQAQFDKLVGLVRRMGQLIAEAERLRSGDGPCHWFAKVLDRLEAGAEPSPWSGVIVLTGK